MGWGCREGQECIQWWWPKNCDYVKLILWEWTIAMRVNNSGGPLMEVTKLKVARWKAMGNSEYPREREIQKGQKKVTGKCEKNKRGKFQNK